MQSCHEIVVDISSQRLLPHCPSRDTQEDHELVGKSSSPWWNYLLEKRKWDQDFSSENSSKDVKFIFNLILIVLNHLFDLIKQILGYGLFITHLIEVSDVSSLYISNSVQERSDQYIIFINIHNITQHTLWVRNLQGFLCMKEQGTCIQTNRRNLHLNKSVCAKRLC